MEGHVAFWGLSMSGVVAELANPSGEDSRGASEGYGFHGARNPEGGCPKVQRDADEDEHEVGVEAPVV